MARIHATMREVGLSPSDTKHAHLERLSVSRKSVMIGEFAFSPAGLAPDHPYVRSLMQRWAEGQGIPAADALHPDHLTTFWEHFLEEERDAEHTKVSSSSRSGSKVGRTGPASLYRRSLSQCACTGLGIGLCTSPGAFALRPLLPKFFLLRRYTRRCRPCTPTCSRPTKRGGASARATLPPYPTTGF